MKFRPTGMKADNVDYVAITLHYSKPRQTKDLLLPLDMPQYMLVDSLVEALGITVPDDLQPFISTVDVQADHQIVRKTHLPLQATLRDVGIRFGQQIALELQSITSRLSLICLQGPVFNINKDEILIGCQKGIDVDLSTVPNQEYVSARHARISSRNGSYYLIDIGSTNGTMLNGKFIQVNQEQLLGDGDVILLGNQNKTGVELIVKIKKPKGAS